MAVWSDSRNTYYQIYAARITPAGAVLEPNGISVGPLTSTYQYYPSIAYTGTRFFVVWSYSSPYAITGRFINTDGSISDTFRIATASNYIYNTRIAYDGTNFFVAWVEYTASEYTVKGQRVSNTGLPIGSTITIASPVYYYNSLGLRFDGTNYIVTYSTPTIVVADTVYQIWGRKYNTSGSPVGVPFRISNSLYDAYYGDVVPGANNRYLNVWCEYRTTYDIYGNIDIPIVDIEESNNMLLQKLSLKTSVVTDMIELDGLVGKEITIFDVFGRKIGTTTSGRYDCHALGSGIYFIQTPSGEPLKFIKIK